VTVGNGAGAARARPVALYARVSTADQTCDTQLLALRGYAEARGWQALEYADEGVSGTRDHRPKLDTMMTDVRRRKVSAVVVVKLDRLARSVHHLVTLAKELEALGVDLVVLDQGIDSTTPSGRLLFHVLAAIAEFERELIRERVLAGLRRARARGKRLGRPPTHHVTPVAARAALEEHGGRLRATARALKLHPETLRRALRPSTRTTC